MTKDMQPHQLGSFGAHIAEAIANKIADERDHWKAQADCEMKRADTAEDALSEMRARAECAEAELAAVRDAAHVQDDWAYGLPSWVNQRLYAAYIGAAFSPQVLEQIRTGRLAFPEAPIYAKATALRADLDAARAELAALKAAQAWQSVNESPPESGDYIGVNMDDKNPVVRCVHYDRDYDSDDEWPWSLAYDGTFEPISHWRPLPTAPDDGGEEK